MRHLITVLLLLTSVMASAQTGNYFLSNYTPGKDHFDNVCFDMAQDKRGVMYFGTKFGILEFDGRNWDVLKGESAVYGLDINSNGEMFWAGAKGFGQITYDNDGFQHLHFLSDSTVTDVFQNIAVQDNVYFLREDALFIYNSTSKEIKKIKSTGHTGLLTGVFELFGSIHVNTAQAGVYKLQDDKFVHSSLPFQEQVIFFSRIENTYVLGTADNKLFVCDENLNIKEIPFKDQEYANASVVIHGSWIDRHLLALGTLRGGVMFINPITGITEEIINYETGLPDNEVFALATDQNKDVWVAHDYGFTRVSPFMPLRSFSHYTGLQGNLLCAYSAESTVYVGTSLGLYKLQKEDVFEELVYYVDVEIPKPTAKQIKNPEKEVEETTEKIEEEQSAESKKKGLFNFLRRKKNRNTTTTKESVAKVGADEATSGKPSDQPDNAAPTFRREKRTKRILRASQNVYKKVDGADSKITMLLQVDGSLIAAGLGGIFEIADTKSKVILEEPVRYIYASSFHNMLFAATYNNEIKALVKKDGNWQQVDFLEGIDDQIDYIFEGNEKEMWICGLDNIYQLGIADQRVDYIHNIDIPNPDVEVTLGVNWGGSVMFVNGSGFYSFDRTTGNISKVDSLPTPQKYFASEGHIFYRDDHGWHVSGQESKQTNLQLLNLFPDLRYITTDQRSNNFWMISGSNNLYKFYSDRLTTTNISFPVFLKSITNNNRKIGRKNNIHFSEDKSSVSFEIVQPDFISPDAVEFRYMLQGINESWSDWSGKNTIHFDYLPPGEYTLLVESRNVFGKVMELEPMQFEVLPPYWKRAWFYAMEFAVLTTLVLLSHRLNTRYRIVSRVLSLLTIILLIQFIQTFIDTTVKFEDESPVIHFILQVCVALVILPVEGFLRNLMFGSLEGSGIIARLFRPRQKEAVVEEEEEEAEFQAEDPT
jgi:hypothetical protein